MQQEKPCMCKRNKNPNTEHRTPNSQAEHVQAKASKTRYRLSSVSSGLCNARTHPRSVENAKDRLPRALRVKAHNIDAEQAIADMATKDLDLDDLMLLIEPGAM